MSITANFASLKTTKPHEYAIRFLFGGLITAATGIIAKEFGPVVAGLFLAFPAIFPASVTLIAKHEKERKRKEGYDGTRRGRAAAAADAAGTSLGSLALLAFALIVWRLLPTWTPWLILPLAAIAWAGTAVLLWLLRRKL
jgi:MFS family permease